MSCFIHMEQLYLFNWCAATIPIAIDCWVTFKMWMDFKFVDPLCIILLIIYVATIMRIGCYLPSVSLHNYCLHIATCNLLVTCDCSFGYRCKRSHHERPLPIQICWITYIQLPCMPILIWCKQCPNIDSCAKQWSKHVYKKRASKYLEAEKKV